MADITQIAELFRQPMFHLDKVTDVYVDGQPRRLRLDFSIPKPSNAPPYVIFITSGWFVVSPEDQWALHAYGIIRTSSTSEETTRVGYVEYARGSIGELQPLKCGYKWYAGRFTSDPTLSNRGVVPVSGEEFEFKKLRFGNSPEIDFTLSAFGLPEFGQTVAQASASRSYPWWILGAAIVAIVAAFALRRLSTRTRAVKDQQIS